MAGSLFPDIDNASSKIGNRIKPASILIQLFFGHRTVFHAPLLYVTALFVITARYPQHQTLAAGFLIGVLSHLILDMMNPAGIPLLWPMRKRFAIPVVHSGSIFDRILGVALWILAGTLIVAALFS